MTIAGTSGRATNDSFSTTGAHWRIRLRNRINPKQGFTEGRIQELEAKLARAEVIDPADLNAAGKVVFGAWVDLWEEEGDREVTYQIVGELETDVSIGKVSHSSPIARALLGQEVGDEIEFTAPGGTRRYEVLKVRYQAKSDDINE